MASLISNLKNIKIFKKLADLFNQEFIETALDQI